MKKQKLCLITGGHWAAVMGGAQYQVKCLLDELIKRDAFQIYYLARNVNTSYTPEGYEIMQIAKPSRIRNRGFFFDIVNLNSLLKKISPDVIYQRGLQSYTGSAAYYAKSHGSKFIYHVACDYDVVPSKILGGDSLPNRIDKRIGEYGLKHASDIIVQTPRQAKLLNSNYGRQAAEVIPNFHPHPKEAIQKKETPIKIVWVSNFKPIKQPELFVKLAQDMQNHSGLQFLMIGRSGNSSIYNNLFKEIEGINNLTFVGEKSIDEVNQMLATSHIFVNTSLVEGYANTFIQAWMRRVPVVSLSVETDDNFDDNRIGFCGHNYDGLKSAVKRLVGDHKLRNAMGKQAQVYALKNNSMSNAAKLISVMSVKQS